MDGRRRVEASPGISTRRQEQKKRIEEEKIHFGQSID